MPVTTIYTTPIAQPRHKIAKNGRKYLPKPKGKKEHPVIPYKKLLADKVRETMDKWGIDTSADGIWMKFTFWLPRPKHKWRKTKENPTHYHTSKPDSDNLIKAVKDALTGVLYLDDSQLCGGSFEKFVCGDDQPDPCVTLEWHYLQVP